MKRGRSRRNTRQKRSFWFPYHLANCAHSDSPRWHNVIW